MVKFKLLNGLTYQLDTDDITVGWRFHGSDVDKGQTRVVCRSLTILIPKHLWNDELEAISTNKSIETITYLGREYVPPLPFYDLKEMLRKKVRCFNKWQSTSYNDDYNLIRIG